jgi:hypothetical protein
VVEPAGSVSEVRGCYVPDTGGRLRPLTAGLVERLARVPWGARPGGVRVVFDRSRGEPTVRLLPAAPRDTPLAVRCP